MKKHWTPTYILNRIKTGIYWKLNPDKPWLSKEANEYLDKNLNKQMIGLEFGSGRSTVYFSKKLLKLVSVENHEAWYENVKAMLAEKNIDNVDYKLFPVDDANPGKSEYHKVPEKFDDEYFDFVLIDGRNRDLCTLGSIPKLKSKGLLVIDNVNRYLPSNSITPDAIPNNSAPQSQDWADISEKIKTWEKRWISDGVTDTAIFIKP